MLSKNAIIINRQHKLWMNVSSRVMRHSKHLCMNNIKTSTASGLKKYASGFSKVLSIEVSLMHCTTTSYGYQQTKDEGSQCWPNELGVLSPVSVFYFFKDNDEQNSLFITICAILYQLFTQQPELIHHVLSSWKSHKHEIAHEVDELWCIPRNLRSDPSSNVVRVLDGFDECREDEQARMTEKLRLLLSGSSKIRE